MYMNYSLNPQIPTIFKVIKDAGYEARIVGGYVRDYFLERKIDLAKCDVDFATTAPVMAVYNMFKSAGYKAILTAPKYGTVSVIIRGKAFEITTLREDVETNGRGAVVKFCTDWQTDANRRDFTINAIYANSSGEIFDPLNGIVDIEKKALKFVGDASIRIREDALRMVRFFRFYAKLGLTNPDSSAIIAIKKNVSLLGILSKERIGSELEKMLSFKKDLFFVFTLMQDVGVYGEIFPFFQNTDFTILRSEHILTSDDYLLKIMVLSNCTLDAVVSFSNHLKMSNKEKSVLRVCLKIFNNKNFTPSSLLKFAYLFGVENVLRVVLLKLAFCGDGFSTSTKELENWVLPKFPLQGRDLIRAGFKADIKLGAMLKATEIWWIDNNFAPKQQDCILFALQRKDAR